MLWAITKCAAGANKQIMQSACCNPTAAAGGGDYVEHSMRFNRVGAIYACKLCELGGASFHKRVDTFHALANIPPIHPQCSLQNPCGGSAIYVVQ
eukprot:8946323-Pyramimonas_sp.AAC.1